MSYVLNETLINTLKGEIDALEVEIEELKDKMQLFNHEEMTIRREIQGQLNNDIRSKNLLIQEKKQELINHYASVIGEDL